MGRMIPPDRKMTGVDIDTSRGQKSYNADAKGFYTVANAKDAKALRAEGFTEASGFTASNVVGFPCSCGFNAVFRVCGKCGKDNG